jgi:hypothetical protein
VGLSLRVTLIVRWFLITQVQNNNLVNFAQGIANEESEYLKLMFDNKNHSLLRHLALVEDYSLAWIFARTLGISI